MRTRCSDWRPAAGCTASNVSVEGPGYITEHIEGGDAGSTTHDDHDNHDHEEHGDHDHEAYDDHDHEASAEHDHDDDHDHDHEHDGEGSHADINANYEWTCDNVANLEALALRFSDGFASVETINIQVLTSAGAHVVEASADTGSVSLAAP